MSHEKSSTPIDPNDADALGRIVYVNFTTQPGSIGEPASWEETAKWPEERVPWTNSALSVARAVLPEGYVAVPVDDFRVMFANFMPVYSSPEMADRWYRMKALLPEEAGR